MKIKKFIQDKLKNLKEQSKKRKELNEIKDKAYFEEMRRQNKLMGKKQAKIEAMFREKKFIDNLEKKEIRKEEKTKDYFGLNKAFPEYINII